jgi:hypothetical protein
VTFPLVLFFVFTALFTAGVFWIARTHKSLPFAIAMALLTLAFMGGILAFLVLWLWPQMNPAG